MNVAIVGCGHIANTHAKALRQQGQTFALAVDADAARAGAFGGAWGAKATSANFVDALSSGVDVVHLCTPPPLHYEMAKQALAAGKHVICEKPLAPDVAEAKELAELADAKNCVAAVNFNVRFHEACSRAKSIISSSDFGDIAFVHGRYLQEFHLMPADFSWRYNPALGGKMRAVTEIGSHWVDLARFWTGLEVKAVSATFGNFSPDRAVDNGVMYPAGHPGSPLRIETEDAAVVTLRFSNGALGSMLLSEVSAGRSNQLSLEVSGTASAVWWSSEDPYRVNHGAGRAHGHSTTVNAFGGGFPDTFAAFFAAVYGALEHGPGADASSYPTFADGWKNAAVCDAIFTSAQSGSAWTPVSL